jgi:hypothetical protein
MLEARDADFSASDRAMTAIGALETPDDLKDGTFDQALLDTIADQFVPCAWTAPIRRSHLLAVVQRRPAQIVADGTAITLRSACGDGRPVYHPGT